MEIALTLRLPCGCVRTLYAGDVVEIPFGRLPRKVAENLEECKRCNRAI